MKTKTKWVEIEGRFNLAGVQFSDYQLVCRDIKPGTVLDVVGVPSNSFDNRAISIRYKGIHLGWVPRQTIQQSEAWNAHAKGCKCIAVLTAFNKNNPTWCMITVQLKRTVNKLMDKETDDINFG